MYFHLNRITFCPPPSVKLLSNPTTFIDTFVSYNIEPFYFSSSLNWIPSRFQEDIQDRIGDRKGYISRPSNISFINKSRYHSQLDIPQVDAKGGI